MRTRSSESPAPDVVEKSVSASAALAKPASHAEDAPNPEIGWCTTAGLTTTSPAWLDPAAFELPAEVWLDVDVEVPVVRPVAKPVDVAALPAALVPALLDGGSIPPELELAPDVADAGDEVALVEAAAPAWLELVPEPAVEGGCTPLVGSSPGEPQAAAKVTRAHTRLKDQLRILP
jgi:hypothetical protein